MIGVPAVLYALIALFTFVVRSASADEMAEVRSALGKALLWPLFVVKFVVIGLIDAGKDLAA